MLEKIVTKDWIKAAVEKNAILIIGRALVAIFNRQTSEERTGNFTKDSNGRGFTANDARIGTLGAKFFLKHGTLLPWQLKPWGKLDKNGYPRIAKYVRQLNEIANEKRYSAPKGLSPEASRIIKSMTSSKHVA